MSQDLVSLDAARQHCRVDEEDSSGTSPNDPMLTRYIAAASAAVMRYLGDSNVLNSGGEFDEDSSGPLVPADIQQATLLLVGEFFNSREAQQEGAMDSQFGYGYLPRPVVALLYPYRAPVIA